MGREIKSTVIIPNYNGMRYMENCLRALEGEPAHLIVVVRQMAAESLSGTDFRRCS